MKKINPALYALLAAMLSACTGTPVANTESIGLVKSYLMDSSYISKWVDPSTECVYYRYRYDRGVSLSIRYRTDGKPDCPGA